MTNRELEELVEQTLDVKVISWDVDDNDDMIFFTDTPKYYQVIIKGEATLDNIFDVMVAWDNENMKWITF